MSSPLSVVPKKSAVKTRSVAGRQGRALMIKSEDPNSAGMSYRILKKYMFVCLLFLMPLFKLDYEVFIFLPL